jgi:transposase
MEFNVNYSYSHTTRIMRLKFKAKFSKPYTRSHKQSPYYKSSFFLKLCHILKKYRLKYDEKSNTITNLETMEPFLIFSFDESSQQFVANNIRVWSLTKPQMVKNTGKQKVNVAGSYSLTRNGNDDLVFLENSKKETIVKALKSLKKKNKKGTILLLIDNYSSHISNLVKEASKELNIELCYLPPYSPQLQPEEKVWHELKRKLSAFKIDSLKNYKKLKDKELEKILAEFTEKSFYDIVPSKKKWNKVLNNYIKPIIKLFNPNDNLDWEVQKIY